MHVARYPLSTFWATYVRIMFEGVSYLVIDERQLRLTWPLLLRANVSNMGTIVLSHTTALRAIRFARRAYHTLPWDRIGRVEQRRALASCAPSEREVDLSDLARWGIRWEPGLEKPHVLVGAAAARRQYGKIACHVHAAPLPTGALMRMSSGAYCTSPALTALQCSEGKPLGEVLALLMELLGTYCLPCEEGWPDVPDGFSRYDAMDCAVEQVHYRCAPVMTIREIRALAHQAKSSRYSVFRLAARTALAGSASPAETVMGGMFAAPKGSGGFACSKLPGGGIILNHRVDFEGDALRMSSGVPYAVCDAFFPAARIDVEYNGAGHEVGNVRVHDGQRNNGLKGMGVTVLVMNRDQMRDVEALEAIARTIYRASGVRFRYDVSGYRSRQVALLNDLRRGSGLPPI